MKVPGEPETPELSTDELVSNKPVEAYLTIVENGATTVCKGWANATGCKELACEKNEAKELAAQIEPALRVLLPKLDNETSVYAVALSGLFFFAAGKVMVLNDWKAKRAELEPKFTPAPVAEPVAPPPEPVPAFVSEPGVSFRESQPSA